MTDDFELGALLSGGVYTDADTGDFPIHPEKNPDAYEAVSGQQRLLPCAVLSESTSIPSGPGIPSSGGQRLTLRIGFYQASGFATIRQANEHCHAVLDPSDRGEQFGPLSDGRYYIVRYMDTPIRGGQDDQIISADSEGGVSYIASRYTVEIGWLDPEDEA